MSMFMKSSVVYSPTSTTDIIDSRVHSCERQNDPHRSTAKKILIPNSRLYTHTQVIMVIGKSSSKSKMSTQKLQGQPFSNALIEV